MKTLYCDANAHLPMSKPALDAFINCNNSIAGHGHAQSPSEPGRAAANAIEKSRAQIAECLGADSTQIFFTSTCTQACQWAINLLEYLPDVSIIYYSPTEHPAVKNAIEKYSYSLLKLDVNSDGVISTHDLYDYENCVVICIYLQNEIGIIQPIEKIKCKYLFSDMSQAAGKMNINLSKSNIDIAVFGAHKFGGPVGVGFIYLKDPSWWREFGTGSRYFTDRPGTPDTPSIVATAAALKHAQDTLSKRIEQMTDFNYVLETGLEELGVKIIAKDADRSPNTTFIHLPNKGGMFSMLKLAERGIHVGLGSACGSSYMGNSPLMSALGIEGTPHDFMRISTFGEYDGNDAAYFLEHFRKIYKEVYG